MKLYKLQCWFRDKDEKDFYILEKEATSRGEAEEKLRQEGKIKRNVYKIELVGLSEVEVVE